VAGHTRGEEHDKTGVEVGRLENGKASQDREGGGRDKSAPSIPFRQVMESVRRNKASDQFSGQENEGGRKRVW